MPDTRAFRATGVPAQPIAPTVNAMAAPMLTASFIGLIRLLFIDRSGDALFDLVAENHGSQVYWPELKQRGRPRAKPRVQLTISDLSFRRWKATPVAALPCGRPGLR